MSFFLSYTPSVDYIQKKFREYFPYLKIECWTKSSIGMDGVLTTARLPKSARLVNLICDRPLEIAPHETAARLESLFHVHFDVNLKVFRKTANGWTDITLDNERTLFYHNLKGRDASNAIFDFELL